MRGLARALPKTKTVQALAENLAENLAFDTFPPKIFPGNFYTDTVKNFVSLSLFIFCLICLAPVM